MAEEILSNYKFQFPSEKCYLDTRYFNFILDDYEGLIDVPIKLTLKNVEDKGNNPNRRNKGDEWEIPFDIELNEFDKKVVKTPIMLQLDSNIIELARLIIEIDDVSSELAGSKTNSKTNSKTKSKHSNLLIFDHLEKKIFRFEPLKENNYSVLINAFLTDYFAYILPGYSFQELKLHPQSPHDNKCKNKGMCVAYVTKLAAMISIGEDIYFPSDPKEADLDIKKFAAEVEQYYEDLDPNNEDIEYALSQTNRTIAGSAIGAAAGLIIFRSPAGLVAGVLLGGIAGHYTYKGKK